MKKSPLLVFAIIIATALSCTKDKTATPTPAPPATTVEVTVAEGRLGTAAANATVYLYQSQDSVASNKPKYTQVTDQSYQAKITVAYQPQYFIVVKKATESNYYNGLIPTGVYTQAEIDGGTQNLQNPNAVVGGLIYQDTNGDGRINAADDVSAPTISLKAGTDNAFTVTVY